MSGLGRAGPRTHTETGREEEQLREKIERERAGVRKERGEVRDKR